MRYVPMRNATPGMILGRDVYDGDGRLLAAKHLLLTPEYIKSLTELGFPGVYIDDDFTKGIEIQEVINPQIRREMVKGIRDLFLEENMKENAAADEARIKALVTSVIEDILSNADIMCNMVDLKEYDNYTYFHSVNVAVLSALLGVGYGMNKEELMVLTTGALLNDIGKKFLEIDVLNAPRALSSSEIEAVKEHPRLGYEFLRDTYNFSTRVYLGVLEHHEWHNGKGYPLGLAGKDITIEARIIKIADVYDAMVSKRPYHAPSAPSEIVEYLMSRSGMEFDPEIVELFIKKISVYPIGCEVLLSTGECAVIMENYKEFPLRPVVKVLGSGKTIDLFSDKEARNITILNTII